MLPRSINHGCRVIRSLIGLLYALTHMALLPPQVDVLIVGAGPTGLAAALALHKQGCKNMLVVDALQSGENTSRAIVMHAATLEVGR